MGGNHLLLLGKSIKCLTKKKIDYDWLVKNSTNFIISFYQVLWTFSIYLEAVAILPQLFLVSKTGEAETITSHYLFALGSYRGLYLLNWIWRYYFENFLDWISIVAGFVQTVLYCDFFYLYVTRGKCHCVEFFVN